MEGMKKNYKSVTEIKDKLRNVGLDNFLDLIQSGDMNLQDVKAVMVHFWVI